MCFSLASIKCAVIGNELNKACAKVYEIHTALDSSRCWYSHLIIETKYVQTHTHTQTHANTRLLLPQSYVGITDVHPKFAVIS